ncbi:MAG: type III-A CRISPR-associated protein Cas10/Csm1 [bacterium]
MCEDKSKSNELDKITIAGLLHDIGKVVERSYNDEDFKNKKDERFKVQHTYFGIEFLKNELKLNNQDWEDILHHIRCHHSCDNANIETPKRNYISNADNRSSAHDRRKKKDEIYFNNQTDPPKRTPLMPVFITDEKLVIENCYNITAINQKYSFPQEIDGNIPIQNEHYYQEIKRSIENVLKDYNIDKNVIFLVNILEKYTCLVPSTTQKGYYPDISLYDHSKTTAAFATANYLYTTTNRGQKGRVTYILLKCDLSGIQDFIYTISSDDALKTLRARSFYIEFLSEYIADAILAKFELSRANLMSTGGGSFFILLPNINDVQEYIDDLEIKINDWLFENFGNILYIAFDCKPASPNTLKSHIIKFENNELKDNRKKSIKKIWLDLSKEINKKKNQKYKYNLANLFESTLNGTKQCKICRNYFDKLDKNNKCDLCRKFIEFGGELFKGNKYLKIIKNEVKLIKDVENEDETLTLPLPEISLDNKEYFIYDGQSEFQDKDFDKIPIRLNTYYQKKPNSTEAMEFKEIAKQAEGTKKLAVLRMDVDNLGEIFTSDDKYLQDYFAGFTRFHVISRTINDFFKRYVQGICSGQLYEENKDLSQFSVLRKNNEILKRNLTVIYSGGDDLLLVGAWNEVVEVAFDIQEAFKKYTCGTLTLSGAITLHDPTYPVNLMATSSLKALNHAKSKPDKNHIVLFGEQQGVGKGKPYYMAFDWSQADEIKTQVKQLSELDLSRNFIRSVYFHIKNHLHKDDNSFNENKLELIPLVYLLGRHGEKICKAFKDANEKIENWNKLKKNLFEGKQEKYKILEAVFAWLLLLTRESNETKEDKTNDETE